MLGIVLGSCDGVAGRKIGLALGTGDSEGGAEGWVVAGKGETPAICPEPLTAEGGGAGRQAVNVNVLMSIIVKIHKIILILMTPGK
jgi:hypothetical protein